MTDIAQQLVVGEIPQPHIYGIAAAAHRGLAEFRVSQAVLISGESGAGKTEATKRCLSYFVKMAAKREKDEDADEGEDVEEEEDGGE